jgi:membrane-bound lytic murein transglycosylase D
VDTTLLANQVGSQVALSLLAPHPESSTRNLTKATVHDNSQGTMGKRSGRWLGICAAVLFSLGAVDHARAKPPSLPKKDIKAQQSPPVSAGKPPIKAAPPAAIKPAALPTKPQTKAPVLPKAPAKAPQQLKPNGKKPLPAIAKTPARGRLPAPRLPGSEPGKPDEQARLSLTGRYPEHSTATPQESAELRSMRDLDKLLFPPAQATSPFPLKLEVAKEGSRVDASGLPPASKPANASGDESASQDLSWLTTLEKSDLPVRFEPALVRYLTYYKDNPRGRKLVAGWVKRSGRYRDSVIKLLRQYKLPEDLLWLALIESAFDATIHSHAGAAGLWQFMPATGRIYGLTVNRRVDERLDPERATHAALKHLQDLHTRFGTWELAFAAYNWGYGGVLASIRKYNTNDYWELRRLEAGMPYETALYVPKILAIAIAARNCKVFGCDGVELDPPEPFGDTAVDKVAVAPGVTLQDVADAVHGKTESIAALNPHLIGSRLPPLEQSSITRASWTVYVPRGKGSIAQAALPHDSPPHTLATYRVRWGEPTEHIAARFGTSVANIERLNDLEQHESPRAGTTIFVPAGNPKSDSDAARLVAGPNGTAPSGKPIVVVPNETLTFPGRRRVFYRAVFGDTLEDVAQSCGATSSELRRWNHLDSRAALQDGMTLQLFLPDGAQPSNVLFLEEPQVEPVSVESPAFFSYFVGQTGRERIEISARRGDTWRSIAGRYGLSVGMLERINKKSRKSALAAGDKVIVYARPSSLGKPAAAPAIAEPAVAAADTDADDDDKTNEPSDKDAGDATVPAAAPATPEASGG